ncbi:MAG: tetratricopeptide repeat protein [Candidatus Zixiibacteriota bacterium]
MKQIRLIAIKGLWALCLAIIITACSDLAGQGKIPITSSSEKALEYYYQGLDMADNLQTQQARLLFQKAIEIDPKFAMAHLQLAAVQPTTNEFLESFNNAKALINNVSQAERLWILGYEAANITGIPKAQLENFQELANLYPGDERAHYLLGGYYFGQQDWESAIAKFKQAAKINPEFSPLYNQMGYALVFTERYDEAEITFKKYIELIPQDPNPYDSYAELLMKTGRYDEAIEQYKKVLEIKPDFLTSYVGIATNLNFIGKYEEARKQLQIMCDLAGDVGQQRLANSAMAYSYIDEGDFDQGLKQYDKNYAIAEALGDTSLMAGDLALMGFALVEVKGREMEALDKFNKATAMIQASSLADRTKAINRQGHRYNASRAYVAMGNIEEARKYAAEYRAEAEAANNQNQIKTVCQLDGLIASEEGKYDQAIEYFLNSNLQNPWNFFHLAKAYERNGDRVNAKKYYEKAAYFNGLNSSPLACIRVQAKERAEAMQD